MNAIMMKAKRFFLDENISKAKKRYLFLAAFVLMGIFEYVSLKMAGTPHVQEKAVISLTILTALFMGVVTVYGPRLIGLCGIKNLYFSAIVLTLLMSAYAWCHNGNGSSPLRMLFGFVTAALFLMLIMWVGIFMSADKTRPQQTPSSDVATRAAHEE